MSTAFLSDLHTFSLDDLTLTLTGLSFSDDPTLVDTDGSVMPQITDKDGNVLSGVDSEFGYYVTDFLGAEQKSIDGDFAEGHAGNILNPDDGSIAGISIKNAVTDIFRSGLPLGTWSLGLGGTTVKASTEHYVTMADLLSDQRFPGDPDAVLALDDDLRLMDLAPTGSDGALEAGVLHELRVEELTQAMQRAIVDVEARAAPQTYSDLDFDRDGVNDTFDTLSVTVQYDADGDGVPEEIQVAGVDLDGDGAADIADSLLNGYGGVADLTDLIEPNESTVLSDIAFSDDYSVTVKDDGKLLYRWGTAVKRPNDIRMEVDLELPEEWTQDTNGNGIADSLEDGHSGFLIRSAELIINHDITNNPNDQIRPEDYENEGATGRKPSYYIITDPDDSTNTLWVSPVDTYNGEGEALPSYLKLTESGEVDMAAGGIAVFHPDGSLAGYRNTDESGQPIGTVLRDGKLAEANAAAALTLTSADLAAGFTAAWYTTTDREPFEWSYDRAADDPYKHVLVSFRSAEDAAAAGCTEEELVSGPRWRLTPNKFGQDLPGLEVPLDPNSQPPFSKDNIKYETGEFTTTVINLLDWAEDADGDGVADPSPLAHSSGWMLIDPDRVDENGDGLIDEGWSAVNGSLNAGDEMPTGLILSGVTPNGTVLEQNFLDTAIYVKGDRQDSAKLFDIQLEIDYIENFIGTVQQITDLNHEVRTVSYESGAVFQSAVAFALAPTMAGSQTASVALTEVTSTGVTMFLDEPDYLDQWHRLEDVGLVVFEAGSWTLEDGGHLQVGTVKVPGGPTDTEYSVTFYEAFDEVPTVLLQLQTNNGPDWAIVRADNVTNTGFDFILEEEEAGDRIHDDMEILGWAALETVGPSGLVDWGEIDGQAVTLEDAIDEDDFEFTFDSALGLDPIVSGAITSVNGSNTATLRLVDIVDDGHAATATLFVQEERSLDDEMNHVFEDLSIMAFEQAGILEGMASVDSFSYV